MSREDRGNTMIVAVGVLMIVGIVATSVWVKTLGGLEIASFEQKRMAAFEVANSGVDEALFRLEQWDLDAMPPIGNTVFTGSGSTADGDYSYRVTRTGDRKWNVVATGVNRDDRSVRSINTDVETGSRFQHAIYSRDSITLSGRPGQLCSFKSQPGGGASPAECPPGDTALLGTSGTITCSGVDWDEISITIYPPDGEAVRCGDLGDNVNQAPSPYQFTTTSPPPGAVAIPGCTLTACTITPQMFSSLPAGNFVVQNLTLGSGSNQDLCRSPLPNFGTTTIYVTGTLTFADGVYINVGSSRAQRPGCQGAPVGPSIREASGNTNYWPTAPPSDLVVVKTCTEGQPLDEIVRQGNSSPAASMVLDALCSVMTQNGGPHFLLFGAASLYQFDINGSLQLLAWDENLLNLKQFLLYRVKNWREVPPVPNP